jgi:hypothetical protein
LPSYFLLAKMDDTAQAFIDWFTRHGTQNDAIALADFPDMGRGAVATRDIDVCEIIDVRNRASKSA